MGEGDEISHEELINILKNKFQFDIETKEFYYSGYPEHRKNILKAHGWYVKGKVK